MKPNVLFLMMDELRSPQHETKEIKEWRQKYLKAQNYLESSGITFTNNYIASCACSPSRTCLFTGQYPKLHGVSQTEGVAKSAEDPDMFWLGQNTVPTMGDYFEKNGYNCIYSGKWHISNSDIFIPGTNSALPTYDVEGFPNEKNTRIYDNSNVLKDYGFNGYLGPEPTGQNPYNSGSSSTRDVSGRDVIYTADSVKILHDLDKSKDDKPWFLVTSLVNPHDISLYGDISNKSDNYNFVIDPSVPFIPKSPTANADLSTKPHCQEQYKILYQVAMQPTKDTERYRKFYYSLILNADKNLQKVLDAFKKTRFVDNTIIVFISDHGEQLGSQGLLQKWYNAYEESIHVPFVIKIPRSLRTEHTLKKGTRVDILSNNIDVMPTLLGLCNIDVKATKKILKKDHTNVRRLVGRDLSPLLLGKEDFKEFGNKPVLFVTYDNIFMGANMTTFTGRPYLPIFQPTNIQTIVVEINKILWKFSRYYDDPQFWTSPYVQNVVQIYNSGFQDIPNGNEVITNNEVTTVTRAQTLPPEFEMYNLTDDPLEKYNLANPKYSTPKTKKIELKLLELLDLEVKTKILTPKQTPIDVNIITPTLDHLPKINWGN